MNIIDHQCPDNKPKTDQRGNPPAASPPTFGLLRRHAEATGADYGALVARIERRRRRDRWALAAACYPPRPHTPGLSDRDVRRIAAEVVRLLAARKDGGQ